MARRESSGPLRAPVGGGRLDGVSCLEVLGHPAQPEYGCGCGGGDNHHRERRPPDREDASHQHAGWPGPPGETVPLGGGCGGGHQGDQEDGCGGGQLLLIPHYIELALLWIALSRGLVLVK